MPILRKDGLGLLIHPNTTSQPFLKMSKTKIINLIVKTDLSNQEVMDLFNSNSDNMKESGLEILAIDLLNTAHTIIKGITYTPE